MRVVCLHIPRKVVSLGGAIYETKWGLVPAQFLTHQLDDLAASVWEPFSLEFYSTEGTVYVCMAGGDDMVEYLCTGIYSWMMDVEISTVEDYTYQMGENTVVVGADLELARLDVYPLDNFKNFAYNTCAPVLTALSRLPEGVRSLVQVIVRPIRETPQLQMSLAVGRGLAKVEKMLHPKLWFKRDLTLKSGELMRQKCLGRLFWCNVRVSTFAEPTSDSGSHSATVARLTQHLHEVANGLKVVSTANENRLRTRRVIVGPAMLQKIQQRRFERPFRLASNEVSSLWSPPGLVLLPNTAQVLSRKAPPPRTLPSAANDPQISFFGHTNYRNQTVPFGIRRFDRRRHLYALGKSGNGKSCLLQLLIRSDIEQGFGCAVLDPHGDLVDDILRFIPKNRVKDVVLFDPSDVNFPPSFNPMVPARPDLKMRVTLSFLETFRRVFGGEWSDRMDHVLRYAMVALLNIPGSSIVSLRRILSDEEFRSEVIRRSTDEAVRRFWETEFPARRAEFEEGPISQILNRLDELLATDMIRNILGQPQNTFDFREFMDSRKIVLLKVSKGVLGADNASLLGSLIIWKVYEAAMSRADIPVESRQDFYFYVDEFQNFATDSFGEILSESRKYRLCLTFANQFLGQLPASVQQTVFGNVANLLAFRIGAEDSNTVANEFKPRFGPDDLLYLPLREFYLKMSIDGEVQEAFSARTLDLQYPSESESTAKESIAHSRKQYALPVKQAQEQLALSEIMSLRLVKST